MIPFVGPSYQLKIKRQGVQRSINLMPTQIESGSGKAPVYLQPVPGLVQFSGAADTPPPDGGTAEVFMLDYVSHSCNYGFFQASEGNFLLVTDSKGADFSASGYYLVTVTVDATGEVVAETKSTVYATTGTLQTYFYDGNAYAGPVVEIATGDKHMVRIDPDTRAVTPVYEPAHDWQAFNTLPNPAHVLINTLVGVTGGSDTAPMNVVSLVDGSVVQTITLPYLLGEIMFANVARSAATGHFFVVSTNNDEVYKCDTTTGAILDTYSVADLVGTGWSLSMVQLVDETLILFVVNWTNPPEVGALCVLNEDGTTEGFQSFNGKVRELNPMLYVTANNAFYFIATETAIAAKAYGYNLTTQDFEFEEVLALDFAEGQDIGYGTGNFTGSVGADGSVYLSAFTGFVTLEGYENEAYKVFKITPP